MNGLKMEGIYQQVYNYTYCKVFTTAFQGLWVNVYDVVVSDT